MQTKNFRVTQNDGGTRQVIYEGPKADAQLSVLAEIADDLQVEELKNGQWVDTTADYAHVLNDSMATPDNIILSNRQK